MGCDIRRSTVIVRVGGRAGGAVEGLTRRPSDSRFCRGRCASTIRALGVMDYKVDCVP